MSTHYLACDLGAESGRLMAGTLDNNRLHLREIHRFSNTPVNKDGSLQWNLPALIQGLKSGLKLAGQSGESYSSFSTDSWGVDYVLLDDQGGINEPVFHYRDSRTARGVESIYSRTSWETVFGETGIQFMPLNTLFQLAAEPPDRLQKASRILGIGDAFNYLASGTMATELSLASTFQLYDPVRRTWSKKLLDLIGVRESQLGTVVPPGTIIGSLKDSLARECGLSTLKVVATCSHDTGAAVAAVPARGRGWAYLSSGTWSLMGVECPAPIVTAQCRDLNFTNELGYGDTVRLLKNISGLWVIQECRRIWEKQGHSYDYASLTRLASEARPFASLINPADPRFLAPKDMTTAIAGFCHDTGQPAPTSAGEFARCAFESLALLYRNTRSQLEKLTGERIERLHIVGGGSRNDLLNQFTADALQIPVLAGPVEATATGNVLIQAIALGHIESLAAGREIVRNSCEIRTFQPGDPAPWNRAADEFARLCKA